MLCMLQADTPATYVYYNTMKAAVCAGLGAVGVALVAVAAKGLVGKAVQGPLTSVILMMSACISYMFEAPWLFPALIVGGGLITFTSNTFVTHAHMALAVRCMLLSTFSLAELNSKRRGRNQSAK
jgi:chromate transport protein ChrA